MPFGNPAGYAQNPIAQPGGGGIAALAGGGGAPGGALGGLPMEILLPLLMQAQQRGAPGVGLPGGLPGGGAAPGGAFGGIPGGGLPPGGLPTPGGLPSPGGPAGGGVDIQQLLPFLRMLQASLQQQNPSLGGGGI